MMEREDFVVNPKHQYHVSQGGEHACSANNQKIEDYYEYLRLSHFTNEL